MIMGKRNNLILATFFFLPFLFGASSPKSIRDPFKSPLILESKQISPKVHTSPILKYALSELKLVGIVWGTLGRVAVVEAPDGKCYLVRKGEKIGKLQGKVAKIEQEKILVTNIIKDYSGRMKEQEITIKLYKEEQQNNRS